jgi:predicted nucleic acid-binding protein
MKVRFADAAFWAAFLLPDDNWHVEANALYKSTFAQKIKVVTSEMVLVEVLNHLSGFGEVARHSAASFVMELYIRSEIGIIPQSTEQFISAAELYMRMTDKGWGLTDCSSFLIMREFRIEEALTSDKHFTQAGFVALMRTK